MNLWERLSLDMDRHRLLALVGGGGKTTNMYALAKEARDAGKTVVVTTTTLSCPIPPSSWWTRSAPPGCGALKTYGILTVGRLDRRDKMTGGRRGPPALAAADVVLGGGRRRAASPPEGPADHEPGIPSGGGRGHRRGGYGQPGAGSAWSATGRRRSAPCWTSPWTRWWVPPMLRPFSPAPGAGGSMWENTWPSAAFSTRRMSPPDRLWQARLPGY